MDTAVFLHLLEPRREDHQDSYSISFQELLEFTRMHPRYERTYVNLADRVVITLEGDNPANYFVRYGHPEYAAPLEALCREILVSDPSNPYALCAVANLLPMDGLWTCVSDRPSITKRGLYLDIIDIDPSYSIAYTCLSNIMASDEIVTLNNGVQMSSEQLVLKALELDPHDASFYHTLAFNMSGTDTLVIGGVTMTARDLFLKALELTPGMYCAMHVLATRMNDTESIRLPDGRVMTQRMLFLEVIRLHPKMWLTYEWLSFTMGLTESVVLPDGRSMTRDEVTAESQRVKS
jgi:hypothetical protein